MKKLILLALISLILPLWADASRVANRIGDSAPREISHWKLNGNAGDSVDGNSGVIYGATGVEGKRGTALDFTSGENDFVTIAHNANQLFRDGFTTSAWIRTDSLVGGGLARYIIDKSTDVNSTGGFTWSTTESLGSNTINFRINAGTSRSSALNVLSNGTWYHVLTTVSSGGLVTLYVNNAVTGTPGTSGALTGITTTNDFRIGNRSGAVDRDWDGSIDDLRIYPYVLTADEMAFLYNQGTGTEQEIQIGSRSLSRVNNRN